MLFQRGRGDAGQPADIDTPVIFSVSVDGPRADGSLSPVVDAVQSSHGYVTVHDNLFTTIQCLYVGDGGSQLVRF